jgi:two-component system NarL family response regulator
MNNSEPIRIMIADDYAIVRRGLAAFINTQPDMKVVAEASNGREAVELFFNHHPDVLLVDLRMPQMGGLQVISAIRQRAPDARVIVLTTYDNNEDIYRAFRAGAKGYLLKEVSKEKLLECVRRVHRGQSDIAPAAAKRLAALV